MFEFANDVIDVSIPAAWPLQSNRREAPTLSCASLPGLSDNMV
jgi:hypothetical protein